MVIKFIVFVLMISSFGFSSDVSLEMFTINNLWILISAFFGFYDALRICNARIRINKIKEYCKYFIQKCIYYCNRSLNICSMWFQSYVSRRIQWFWLCRFGLANPSGDMIDYANGSYTYLY